MEKLFEQVLCNKQLCADYNLKNKIECLIDMERRSGSMDVISPLYVSRMLNVPLEDVEKCMKEMGI